jgi:gp16 family phage-associated protein
MATSDKIKAQFRREGKTFTAWAKENGYTRNDVYRVLNGQLKGNYGRAHEIASRLGMATTGIKP